MKNDRVTEEICTWGHSPQAPSVLRLLACFRTITLSWGCLRGREHYRRSRSWWEAELRLAARSNQGSFCRLPICYPITPFQPFLTSQLLPGGLEDSSAPTGGVFQVSDWQAFIEEPALERPWCLFLHYFDSEFLQIEDSAAWGLGNFLSSCNVLSLNWFFPDNYLRPLNCSCRQAEGVRQHISIFTGLRDFSVQAQKGEGKEKRNAAPWTTARVRPGKSSKKHASSPSVLIHMTPSPSEMSTVVSFSYLRKQAHTGEIKFQVTEQGLIPLHPSLRSPSFELSEYKLPVFSFGAC